MFSSFIKKLSGSKDNLPSASSASPSGAGTGRSDAQDTLASLGLDPSLLADPEDDDIDPSVDHDPSLAADLDAVQKGTLQSAAKSKPKPKPSKPQGAAAATAKKPDAAGVGAEAELDLDAIHRDLLSGEGDLGSDDEVEIHDHEMADLEAQLSELTGLSPDELELAALEAELNADTASADTAGVKQPKSTSS
ncbi:hypothetical protein BCR44DRAFT_60779 [Catenaria anguillulae PL171]|uniref:Uncharacterized protein n=1 Tax=Catenaria anguillulae PL171 TaxID=765915 RepID=A0A1Y2HE88_9FUNG|nr:hypothetical protein BCR44DRAFT_60779 [Catenaria anguillulae PL171]